MSRIVNALTDMGHALMAGLNVNVNATDELAVSPSTVKRVLLTAALLVVAYWLLSANRKKTAVGEKEPPMLPYTIPFIGSMVGRKIAFHAARDLIPARIRTDSLSGGIWHEPAWIFGS